MKGEGAGVIFTIFLSQTSSPSRLKWISVGKRCGMETSVYLISVVHRCVFACTPLHAVFRGDVKRAIRPYSFAASRASRRQRRLSFRMLLFVRNGQRVTDGRRGSSFLQSAC